MYGHGCCEARAFPTKEEKLEMLKGYKEELENEIKGVEEAIKSMQKNN